MADIWIQEIHPNGAIKTTLPVGLKRWFETKFRGADLFEILDPTEVQLVAHSDFWYKTVGHVQGFPPGHPALLISKSDLESLPRMRQARIFGADQHD